MRKIISVCLLLSMVFSLWSCTSQGDAKQEPELAVSLSAEPNSIDPALCESVCSILTNLFEGLVQVDENGNFSPGIATSWEPNDDYTVYTFYLREDAKWSNGDEITAEDFKYSWLRALAPETASYWAYYMYYIKNAEAYNAGQADASEVGIEVISPYVLEVTLERPCSYFLSLTTLFGYYPVHRQSIEKYGAEWTQKPETFVTNGPFKMSEWNHDANLRVVKNDNYWDKDNVNINCIDFVLLTDSTAIMNAYESGEIDFVEYMITADEMQQIDTVKYADFTYTRHIELNLDNEVFDDIRVRQAISLALNREEMVTLVGEGNFPMTYFIPEGFKDANGVDYRDSHGCDYYPENGDIEEAKRLLSEAGYPDGAGFPTLTYLCSTIEINALNAQIVRDQLKKIGINVEILSLEKKIMNEKLSAGEYDITYVNLLTEYPDISVFFYSMCSDDFSNYANFSSNEYDALYSKMLATIAIDDKFQIAREAEDILMTECPIIPLYTNRTAYVENGRVTGYIHDTAGRLDFRYATIASND